MIKFSTYIIFFFLTIPFAIAQESLSELLHMHNSNSVLYMSVQELAMPKTDAVIIDSREVEEYNVSHIKNALPVGYDSFDLKTVTENIKDKNQLIVVYCSLGIRSERIAEQIQKSGYTNVYNLYGGIFEWKNADFPLYNLEGETNKIHGFSKEWSKWLKKGECVYE
ncbi:rhodanese-like domain-containing protein [Yeosuana sp. MJ-SS3]|uniref:Rhodanese-like domain-containing protein n=1 Tax=Gilvirhabdus luticola TaxID=3079858 RepID=A0ABU3U472_9FLAO|nr:rhodanese-like domain-containing protein [Yeosuana sp. MJ-SS3]MDU8885156.1 rhodanese-like domain-containing protein [Yeosuana sp. MJ-SS3]